MAVVTKKIKGSKDGDKKQAKKIDDEVFRIEERKEELATEVELASPLVENHIIESSASPPPSAPEPVYEEPVLTPLIVSRYATTTNFGHGQNAVVTADAFYPVGMTNYHIGPYRTTSDPIGLKWHHIGPHRAISA